MARPPRKGPGASFRAAEARETERRVDSRNPWSGNYARATFDFDGVDPPTLCDGLHHALAGGATVTFSLTKDGGAVKVSAWVDNRKYEAWAAAAETFNELLSAFIDTELAGEVEVD